MNIDAVLSRLKNARPNGPRSWMACCPGHDDKNPSLSVTEGEGGRVLLRCFAGCAVEKVAAAMGLAMADLMGEAKPEKRKGRKPAAGRAAAKAPTDPPPGPAEEAAPAKKPSERKPFSLAAIKAGDVWRLHKRDWVFVERYDYTDASGSTVYRKMRFREAEGPGKTFIQCVPVDGSLWAFGRSSHGVAEVLYNLPAVLAAAKAGGEVLVVEGEKDVNTAARLGLVATCNADGAGKWQPAFADAIKGCGRVVVIADKDDGIDPAHPEKEYWQGQRHATDVADSLTERGIPHVVLTLPDVDGFHVKDLSDWGALTARSGATDESAARGELEGVIAAAPPWDAATFRRPLREEPSASSSSKHRRTDAGADDGLKRTPVAQNKNAAGGMPHSLPEGGGSPVSSPATPNTGHGKNVGGGGAENEDATGVAFLRRRLIEVMTDKDASGLQKKRAMSREVCAWLGRRGRFYYDLADRGHDTAMWFDSVEKRLHRVGQDFFRSWLSRVTAFSREFKDYKMFVSSVEDEALIGDETTGITPRRYWHREGGNIYLSNGEGRVVRITQEGVDEVDNGTDGVVFEQGYILSPWKLLAEADGRDPFAACSVFSGINTVDGRGLMLVRLWWSGMFGVTGWKPLLVLSGDVGSGKTRVAVAMFQLLGIVQRVTAIDALGNVKDFWASVDKGGLFCLDNADHHIPWLPDALSVISTGGTFEKKKLYTDTETVTQEARCWAAVTSANPSFASDAGLSDRLITVLLQRVERDTAESVLTREIEAARDAGLTWACYVMRRALADKESVPRSMNRRHPDWSEWVFRLGRAAGMATGAETAIRENESYKAMFSVSNDAFGKFLLSGVRSGFRGSADELSQHLASACEGYSPDLWTVAKIGKAMARLSVALKGLFGYEKLNHSGRALYVFQPLADPAAADDAAAESPDPPMLGVVGDVGAIPIKSPVNSSLYDLLPSTPHIPNITPHENMGGGEREEEDPDRFSGPGEEDGWDAL